MGLSTGCNDPYHKGSNRIWVLFEGPIHIFAKSVRPLGFELDPKRADLGSNEAGLGEGGRA